jgi:DNA-binding winged helix-turn-helix (wHTH) protein
MGASDKRFYEFGSFRLDAAEFVLLRDGQIVPLTPKVFETLLVLVENSGHVVDKNELYKQVWQDAFVEETRRSILTQIMPWLTPGSPTVTAPLDFPTTLGCRLAK